MITAVKAGGQFEKNDMGVNRPFDKGFKLKGEVKDLVFVPYYFRANRGGKGHMRVGLKTSHFKPDA